MILPESLIPSDKYFLKNLTFKVCISTRVATSPFQSNSLRGQGEDQQLKKQCPSWPTGRDVMTTSSCWVRGTVGDEVLIQPLTQQEEVVMTSRPVGQEGHCFFSYCCC